MFYYRLKIKGIIKNKSKQIVFLLFLVICVSLVSVVQAQQVVIPNPGGNNPNHSHVYIAEQNSNTIQIADATTNSIINTIRVGETPNQLLLSPSGSTLYIAITNGVDIFNTSTNTVSSTITLSQLSLPTNNFLNGTIALSPDGSKLYVSGGSISGGNKIAVVDTSNNQLITTITTQGGPGAMAINPGGTRLYVLNGSNYQVIDTSNNQIINTISITGGTSLAISPDGSKLYIVSNGNNTVSIYNTSDNSLISSNAIGPVYPNVGNGNGYANIIIKPDGTRAYLITEGLVNVVDTSNSTLVSSIRVCSGISAPGIAVTFNSTGTILYATCGTSNIVDIIDLSTNTETGSIVAEFNPQGLAFKP